MRLVRFIAASAPMVLLAACSDGAERTESAYCGQIVQYETALNAPVISTPTDIGLVLAAWRSIAQSAPVAIEPEWNTMVDMMETAVTVDPDDPESMQLVADTARASEPAAERVVSYTQERCGLTIGLTP
ncbi:MAG: hypothetical protein ABL953_05310 [Ilumatobacteraceae bacterium]